MAGAKKGRKEGILRWPTSALRIPNDTPNSKPHSEFFNFTPNSKTSLRILKVGAHEGTGRRDLLQGLVPCRVYTVEPSCGDMSLEVFTQGDLLRSETEVWGAFQAKGGDEKGVFQNSETEQPQINKLR